MNQRPQINRRDFLRMAAAGAAGATLAACAGTEPATPETYGTPDDSRRIVFNRYDRPAVDGQALYVYADDPVVQLDQGQEFPRNEHQLAGLRAAGLALPAADPLFGATLSWAYREYAVQRLTPPADGEGQGGPLGDAPAQMVDRATRDQQLREVRIAGQVVDPGAARLCLFNVLVALEWAPDPAYMRQLEWAFRRASDFLYDATDGSMAFGQVVFGGHELMDAADIQIMASNRLLPRSWVSGLHLATKYMPIRVGRGVWNDRNRLSIPWDEPEAYRTLVHEWGHYALELRDAYLERRQLIPAGMAGLASAPDGLLLRANPSEVAPITVVMPYIGRSSGSIMETTEGTSELAPHALGSGALREGQEWALIQKRYPWLNPPPQTLDGPGRLPLPLPRFQRLGSLATGSAGLVLRDFPSQLQLDRCWVYVLPGTGAGGPHPERVIAQGTLDARTAEDGFRLLGARPRDAIVLIGQGRDGRPAVFRGTIDAIVADGLARVAEWRDVTPETFPAVTVIPEPMNGTGKLANIRVQVSGAGRPPDQLWVYPLGQGSPRGTAALGRPDRPDWISAPIEVPTLDGYVLASWGSGALLVYTFSQGGGPSTHSPSPANPFTAGSSEGNVALFFHDEERASAYAADPAGYPGAAQLVDYSDLKIVTTVAHGGADLAPPGAREQSYILSLAGNGPLPLNLAPTLVVYYDTLGERELLSGDLRIYRLAGDTWQPLPTYLPPGYPFAVIPLDARTAPGLIGAGTSGPRIERYRLYWTPRTPGSAPSGTA